ncbi:hypothetical protein BDZ45DRAFT_48788 [Acephala macrosclerotiorum]|nr:hypothetical protein BDZ45DRAFT_48788 [Acephala macrosclerotiorum]
MAITLDLKTSGSAGQCRCPLPRDSAYPYVFLSCYWSRTLLCEADPVLENASFASISNVHCSPESERGTSIQHLSGAEFYSAGVPYEPVAPRELNLLCRLD